MSRTDYGEGSVYQRKDGRWCATYWDHGRRMSVYGRTEKEAKAGRKAALKRINDGLPGSEPRATFSSVARRWVEVTSRTANLSDKSRRVYLDVLKLHVEPVIGSHKIAALRPSHVSQVLVTMQDKGLSASYRHQAHKAMSHVFKAAIADGLINTNPTTSVPAPRGLAKPRVVPDGDTVKEMIRKAPDERLRTYLVITAHTGLRISEVLALRWGDVNSRTDSVAVRNGKGGRSRAVVLTPSMATQLAKWKVVQAKERLAAPWWSSESDWIITTDIGTQMDPHNWRKKHFNPLRDLLAPGATPHSLRHAFATIMLEEGVAMRVVAEQMGHSSTRITESTYSHVTARLQAEAGAAIERALAT